MEVLGLFRFRLARELGKSLAEIDEITLKEFYEWYEYSNSEPFSVERNELMIAQLTAAVLNIEIAKSKSNKYREPLDFLISVSENTKKEIKQKKLDDGLMSFMMGVKKCQ